MARKSRQPQQQGILPASPSNENKATVYRTGIYARLSDKNFSSTDVDVLGNQLNHLRDYVANHDDMELVDTYVDDGWRGSSFNRPDFNRMMADVKSGRINCIVVRDFSRFGRNYLEMGYYLNEVFPSYNLRFISIFDDFDSLVSDADSIKSFRALFTLDNPWLKLYRGKILPEVLPREVSKSYLERVCLSPDGDISITLRYQGWKQKLLEMED